MQFHFVYSQLAENEKWRYILLSTTLYNNVPGIIWHDSLNTPLNDAQLYNRQIEEGRIKKANEYKTDTIHLYSITDSVIQGYLYNGKTDTLIMELNAGFYTEFETQVFIKNHWYTFQISGVMGCGMTIGKAKLFPGYLCGIELERTTKGNISLPFRLLVKVGNRTIHSNEIRISCNKNQYKMINKRIKPFTF